jgi:diguanylate cyclase (GGDEF)-like protein
VVTVARDITLQKQEEMRLRELAQRDALSGLLNRAGLEHYLVQALAEGRGASLALLYIDLDRFKPVNDQHGHAVGDQVLQVVAARLLRAVRPTDGVARLGGDEFAIVLSGVNDPMIVQTVAQKVIASVNRPVAIGHQLINVGASVGVAFGVARDAGWPELIARADANLYKAKAAGRGLYVDEG